MGADDSATPVIDAAEDAAEEFDGTEADAEISVDDSATQVVDAATDAVENFDGRQRMRRLTLTIRQRLS